MLVNNLDFENLKSWIYQHNVVLKKCFQSIVTLERKLERRTEIKNLCPFSFYFLSITLSFHILAFVLVALLLDIYWSTNNVFFYQLWNWSNLIKKICWHLQEWSSWNYFWFYGDNNDPCLGRKWGDISGSSFVYISRPENRE